MRKTVKVLTKYLNEINENCIAFDLRNFVNKKLTKRGFSRDLLI
jgi:hypothetical protein